MNDIIPEERVAQVERVQYSSSIAIVTFRLGEEQFTLYGDHRICSPIEAYIGKLVRLHIVHSADWTWQPLEEPNEEVEDE